MTNEKITNFGRKPESPKLKNTSNREQPGKKKKEKKKQTKLEERYKIYPNMNCSRRQFLSATTELQKKKNDNE